MTIKVFTYFLFVTLFVSFGCKKKEATTSEPVSAATTTNTGGNVFGQSTALSIKFTVSIPSTSSTVNYSYTPSLSSASGGYYGPSIGQPFRYYSSIFQMYNGNPSPSFSVFKSDTILRTFTVFNDSVFVSLNKTGNYKYALTTSSGNIDNFGIRLSFTDNNNVNWSTVRTYPLKPYQPNTSTFNIIETANYLTQSSSPKREVKYKATFGCKLYNNTGDSIFIQNGEITGTTTKF